MSNSTAAAAATTTTAAAAAALRQRVTLTESDIEKNIRVTAKTFIYLELRSSASVPPMLLKLLLLLVLVSVIRHTDRYPEHKHVTQEEEKK